MPDPLSSVDAVTPQLLETLGVAAAEIQEALTLGAYEYWTEILRANRPWKQPLQVIEEFLQLPGAERFDRVPRSPMRG